MNKVYAREMSTTLNHLFLIRGENIYLSSYQMVSYDWARKFQALVNVVKDESCRTLVGKPAQLVKEGLPRNSGAVQCDFNNII